MQMELKFIGMIVTIIVTYLIIMAVYYSLGWDDKWKCTTKHSVMIGGIVGFINGIIWASV